MQTPPAGAAHRFATALLRSPMAIALGHLFELLHHADFVGHKPVSQLKHIGPQSALYLQRPLSLNGFHNPQAITPYMTLLHLRLQHAVYPVHSLVVEKAPGDGMLGLPFRCQYNVATPPNFCVASAGAHQTAVRVSHACLGVPKGYMSPFRRLLPLATQTTTLLTQHAMGWTLKVSSLQCFLRIAVSTVAYGCPLVDSNTMGRPLGKPRCPFQAASLMHALPHDEYGAMNSLCYGDLCAECPLGGEDNPFSYSEHRIHCLDNLKRYLSATREPHPYKRGCLHLINFADSTFCADTLYSLRQRHVQAEEYSTFKCSQEPVYGFVSTSEVQSSSIV
jgi:hypothetical protein